MSVNVLKGDAIKLCIIWKQYIPFGSSELSRISPFHPSVLAENTSETIVHFAGSTRDTIVKPIWWCVLQEMLWKTRKSSLLFLLSGSLKWCKTDYFNTYYSELQTYDWLFSMKKVTPADRYLARRLLTFSKVKENDTLTAILQTIKREATLPESLNQLRSQWNMLKRGWSIQQYWVERSTAKSIMSQNDYQTIPRNRIIHFSKSNWRTRNDE